MQGLKRAAYLFVTVIGGGIVLFFFFKYLFGLLLPFLIAWTVAFATAIPAARLHELTHIPLRILRTIISVLIALSLLSLAGGLIYLLGYELSLLLGSLGEGNVIAKIIDLFGVGFIGEALDAFGDSVGEVFKELFISLAATLGSSLSGVVKAVPTILFFVLITVIATIYFALDLDGINRAIGKLLPRHIFEVAVRFKRELFTVGRGYIKSYLLLMLITFSVMLVGLLVLGQRYALLLAVVIAFLDLLPVIGVGTILIPWGIFEIILGDTPIGIGLIVLFALHELLRQLVEPKIVSRQLGVHPVLTLALIYIGCSLFGFVGILLVPIACVLINLFIGEEDTSKVDKPLTAERNKA